MALAALKLPRQRKYDASKLLARMIMLNEERILQANVLLITAYSARMDVGLE